MVSLANWRDALFSMHDPAQKDPKFNILLDIMHKKYGKQVTMSKASYCLKPSLMLTYRGVTADRFEKSYLAGWYCPPFL